MSVEIQAAYASCERAARAHYENFPVASLFLPRRTRRHIAAVYAFARTADDFADEGDRPVDERLRLLDGWEARLRAAADGRRQASVAAGEPAETPEIFLALGNSIRACALPVPLLADLISAFRQDVTVTRYSDWEPLFDYCRRSANPVGRLVLRIAGYRDPRLDGWSDAICTALQLTNFWQDMKIDFARGRIYVPQSIAAGEHLEPSDFAADVVTPAMRRVLDVVARRTHALYQEGRPLCDAVTGRLRYELRATWLGGTGILHRVEGQRVGAPWKRPVLRLSDLPWLAWQTLAWSAE